MAITTLASVKTHLGIPSYATGTITYVNSTRIVTLTGGSFPSWVSGKVMTIAGVDYTIASLTDSTHLVLSSTSNPGGDLASATAYAISSSTTEDSQLAQFIEDADAVIKAELDRNIESASYTEFYSGTNRPELVLRQRPVTAVTSVYLDSTGYFGDGSGGFAAATLLVAGTDYAVDWRSSGICGTGILYRVGGVWPARMEAVQGLLTAAVSPGRGNIKVTYTAGFTTVPKDITFAANMLVATMRRLASLGVAVQSESLDYYSYSLASNNQSNSEIGTVKRTLARYQPMIW